MKTKTFKMPLALWPKKYRKYTSFRYSMNQVDGTKVKRLKDEKEELMKYVK